MLRTALDLRASSRLHGWGGALVGSLGGVWGLVRIRRCRAFKTMGARAIDLSHTAWAMAGLPPRLGIGISLGGQGVFVVKGGLAALLALGRSAVCRLN